MPLASATGQSRLFPLLTHRAQERSWTQKICGSLPPLFTISLTVLCSLYNLSKLCGSVSRGFLYKSLMGYSFLICSFVLSWNINENKKWKSKLSMAINCIGFAVMSMFVRITWVLNSYNCYISHNFCSQFWSWCQERCKWLVFWARDVSCAAVEKYIFISGYY